MEVFYISTCWKVFYYHSKTYPFLTREGDLLTAGTQKPMMKKLHLDCHQPIKAELATAAFFFNVYT